MKRCALLFVGLLVLALPVLADTPLGTARATWEAAGSPPSSPAPLAPSTPGTLWDNGAADLVNGVTSERNTAITGTGGPEGDHASTIADDFALPSGGTLAEVRACLFISGGVTLAEMYVYADAGGTPGAAPIAGAPTTADLVTTTYTDNTVRCPNAFGLIGREFQFVLGGSVVLPAGTYWLAVVGDGQGDLASRAFRATSGVPFQLNSAVIGSTVFTYPYWTTTLATHAVPEFAFDIDGPGGAPATEVPAISGFGVAALCLLIGLAALFSLRKNRKAAA